MRDRSQLIRVTRRLTGWLCQQVFQRAKDQGQRRAELVTDIREENGLGAVDFSQCFRPPALLLVGSRISDAGCDLRRDQLKKVRYRSSNRRRALMQTTRKPAG